ncbi:MAG TPA: tRNA lysidine(34) synthetase TilS [Caulobacter sp.]|nr:tRNA lysidine(34) synthetase TilS [Caulobacter sp.]
MRGLAVQVRDPVAGRVADILDQRLETHVAAPLAVALSGGSDSLALLHLVSGWARLNGRPVVALTVDHGLQEGSAGWAERCAAMAAERGRAHRTLVWTGEKPKTGLPAAARAARHALLAEAARREGARVLLMGHTASDLGESAAMRAAGSTVPDAREWAPSPAWPEGRGVFVLRPLLTLRRGELQDWLAARGVRWIDDPANLDLRYARARARIAGSLARPGPLPRPPGIDIEARHGQGGEIVLSREARARVLGAACLCAAGTTIPPHSEALTGLTARLATPETFAATLAGARIEAAEDRVTVFRETGELSRRPLAPLPLSQDEAAVFDGRFELIASAPGLAAQPLWGHARRLPKAERAALKALPAAARGGLPLVTDNAALWTCPILAASPFVRARSLVQARFEAALGLVAREADAHPVAEHGEAPGGVLS